MSPFDSAKFEALTEGLEITVLPLSEVASDNPKIRIDSTHFVQAAVRARKLIEAGPNENFGGIVSRFRKGIFDIKADSYVEPGAGVPFVRISDLVDGLVDESKTAWISADAHKKEAKTAVQSDDIVLSKTAYPAAALVTLTECNVSQDMIAVKLSREGLRKFRPAYVVTFLNSKLGQTLLWSEFQGNVQQHLSLDDGRKIRIPQLGTPFQERVQRLFQIAVQMRREASAYLRTADQKILASLGLANRTPPEPLTYTLSASAVFTAQRLDAQYFMPAKRDVQRALEAMPGMPLGQLYESVRDMFDPGTAPPDMLTRNYDVTDALTPILDDEKRPTPVEEIGSTKKRLQCDDVVISRLRAYLHQIAVVRASSQIPAVGSSEFIVLRPVEPEGSVIAPETLMMFLRSAPVQTILKWCQDGSQHPRFSERDLLSIHIPNVVASASNQICAIVQEAFAARRKARDVLALAQRVVEIAVEQSERVALRALDDEGPVDNA